MSSAADATAAASAAAAASDAQLDTFDRDDDFDQYAQCDAVDEDEVLSEKPKSILLSLISQVTIGMDLSRVTLPTFILEPRSLLERSTDFASHPHLMARLLAERDPQERMVHVVRWLLSGWHLRPRGVKKPFNPILGEVFRCHWDHPEDGSRTTFLAEQVSHHPPCSAYWCENRRRQFIIEGEYYPRSRFLGNSVASMFLGYFRVHLLEHGEVYHCTLPNVYCRGILFGTLRIELAGKTNVVCEKSGYHAEIEFKSKGMIRGKANQVQGRIMQLGHKHSIYEIHGKWSDVVYIKNLKTKTETELIDVRTEPILKKSVAPIRSQLSHESRRLWRNLTLKLQQNDFDGATQVKSSVEEYQRQLRREREEAGSGSASSKWTPSHFHDVGPIACKVRSTMRAHKCPGAEDESDETDDRLRDWKFNAPLFEKYQPGDPLYRDLFAESKNAEGSLCRSSPDSPRL